MYLCFIDPFDLIYKPDKRLTNYELIIRLCMHNRILSEQKMCSEIHNGRFFWNVRIRKYQKIAYYSANVHQSWFTFPAIMTGKNVSWKFACQKSGKYRPLIVFFYHMVFRVTFSWRVLTTISLTVIIVVIIILVTIHVFT